MYQCRWHAADYALQFKEYYLADMLLKYRSCHDQHALEQLKIEDVIFLITGCSVLGHLTKDNIYEHIIITPEERKQYVLSLYSPDVYPIIRSEYDNVLIPLWNLLCHATDMERCKRRVENCIYRFK